MKVRDSQRQKVYDAERLVPWDRKFASIEECKAFVDKVTNSPYVVKHYGSERKIVVDDPRPCLTHKVAHCGACVTTARVRKAPDVTVRAGRGSHASPWNGVTLGKHHYNELIVIHELVHVLVGSEGGAWHNWRFCATYLDLVRHAIGKETHDELKAAFKAHRVKFTAPRAKRELTEEQRQVLRERIAKARAAKLALASSST